MKTIQCPELDLAVYQTFYFGNFKYLAGAVTQPAELDNDVNGACELSPHGRYGEVHTSHQHHGLQPEQGVPRAVGMPGGHGAVVSCIHCLDHIDSLGASDLSDNDAVRPHSQ